MKYDLREDIVIKMRTEILHRESRTKIKCIPWETKEKAESKKVL